MGVYPIIMNILQFWLIDTIVKDKHLIPEDYMPVEVAPGEPEPLLADTEREGTDDSDIEEGSSSNDQSKNRSARSPSRSTHRSRRPSARSNTSEPKSFTSSFRKSKDTRIPSPISVHNYPPPTSQEGSPVGSPKSLHQSLRKRSPPPSPSPITTPNHYGATAESPRMRQPSTSGSGWAWEASREENDDVRDTVSSRSPPTRREVWHLPVISPPSKPNVSIHG